MRNYEGSAQQDSGHPEGEERMSDGLSGVHADPKYSYRSLEQVAMRIRKNLNYPADKAINALHLFEDLHKVGIKMRDGRLIPLMQGVVSLEDSEGYIVATP